MVSAPQIQHLGWEVRQMSCVGQDARQGIQATLLYSWVVCDQLCSAHHPRNDSSGGSRSVGGVLFCQDIFLLSVYCYLNLKVQHDSAFYPAGELRMELFKYTCIFIFLVQLQGALNSVQQRC